VIRIEEEVIRVRIPKGKEVLGVVNSMLGSSRFNVSCQDGNGRICRVSGKFKRRVWINLSDVVLIKPWEVQSNERGDIIWKYSRSQAEWLRKNSYLK
jgi:translation initiation factor 1A